MKIDKNAKIAKNRVFDEIHDFYDFRGLHVFDMIHNIKCYKTS